MNYSPKNCHPINLKESLTIPVSRHLDFIWNFNILMILHELLAVMYVIITFALVLCVFNKTQDESIYSEKYC